jgi:putative peptidoglycan lipid II flippase
VKIAVVTLVITQLLNLALIGPLAHAGLALAIGLGACLNAGLLYWQLRRRGMFQPQPGWPVFLGKLLVAVTLMGLILLAIMHFMPDWAEDGMLLRLLRLGALVTAGAVAYFGCLLLLGFRMRDFARRAVV